MERHWFGWRAGAPGGLLASVGELSTRASLFAIALPVGIVAALRLTGHSLSGSSTGDLSFPALALAIASFVLIPMLALTGATTALMVGFLYLWFGRGSGWRTLFLCALGAWSLVMAYYYDVVIIPAVT